MKNIEIRNQQLLIHGLPKWMKSTAKMVAIASVFGSSLNVQAAVNNWIGAASDNYTNPAAWSSGAVPGIADTAIIGNSTLVNASVFYTNALASPFSTNLLSLLEMNTNTGVSTFTMSDGMLLITNASGAAFSLGAGSGAVDSFSQSGGTLVVARPSTGSLYYQDAALPGNAVGADGVYTNSGGVADFLCGVEVGANGSGTFSVNGGVVVVNGWFGQRGGGTITDASTFDLNSGSMYILRNPSTDGSGLAGGISFCQSGYNATVNITGGNLYTTSLRFMAITANNPYETLNIAGGNIYLGYLGVYTNVSGGHTSVNTINISGGTFHTADMLPVGTGTIGSTNTILTDGTNWLWAASLPASLLDSSFTVDGVAGPGYVTFAPEANRTITLSNQWSGDGGLVVSGPGTVLLGATNTFTGGVQITGGTLKVGKPSALGSLNASTTANGGTLDLNGVAIGAENLYLQGWGAGGTNGAINNSSTVEPSQTGGPFYVTMTGDTAFNASGTRWDVSNGGIVGQGAFNGNGYTLYKIGGNQIQIHDVGETSIGNLVVSNGTLGFQGVITMGDPTKSASVYGPGNLRFFNYLDTDSDQTIYKNIFLYNGAILSVSGGTNNFADPITLTGTNTMDVINSGSILNILAAIGGTGGFNKLDSALLLLQGVNTYTGPTFLNAGSIELEGNGSIATTPLIQLAAGTTLDASERNDSTLALASGQKLAGSGTVIGTLSVGNAAVVGVGSSTNISTLTNTGSLLLQGGGTLVVKVQDALAGPGVGNDCVAVSGNVGVLSSGANKFTIKLVSLTGSGAAGSVANFVNTTNYTWVIASGAVTNFTGTAFNVDTTGFANALGGGHFFVTTSSGNLVLYYTPASVGPTTIGGVFGNLVSNVGGNPSFGGFGIPGYVYGVESATSVAGPWAEAGNATAASNGAWSFIDLSRTNPATLFYRLYYPDNPGNPPH